MELTNEFRVGVPVEQAWEVLTDVERIAPCMPGAQLQEIEGDEYRGVVKVKVGPITAQYKGAARFVEQDVAAHRAVLRAEGRETRGQGNANATITAQLEPDGDGTKISVATDLTITGRVAQFGRGVLADVSSKLLGQFADCLETKLLAGEGTAAGDQAGAGEPGGAPSPSTPRVQASSPGSAVPGPRDIASEGAAATLQPDVTEAAQWPGQRASTASAAAAPTTEATSAAAGDADRARANGTSGPAVRVVDSPEAEPVDLLEAAGAPVAKRLAPAAVGLTVLWLLSVFLRRRRRRR
ncbi:MAG TPA: SRPBCC family protein [Acidimicrobiales bacterium]|nr:SRPBCC family protein [Acidimicrobiales bacterium]